MPGFARSNGNSEGFNHWYKGKYFNNRKLPLREFVPKFFEALKDISRDLNPFENPLPLS